MPLQRLASTLPLPKEEKRHKFQFIEVGWYPRKRAYSFTIHSQTADSTGCLFVHIRRKGISPFWQQERNSFQSQIVLFQGKESDALKQGQSLMPACMSFFSLWFDKGSLHSLERGFRSISGISYSWTLTILLWCTSSSMPAGRLWTLLLRQEIRLGHVLTPSLPQPILDFQSSEFRADWPSQSFSFDAVKVLLINLSKPLFGDSWFANRQGHGKQGC